MSPTPSGEQFLLKQSLRLKKVLSCESTASFRVFVL